MPKRPTMQKQFTDNAKKIPTMQKTLWTDNAKKNTDNAKTDPRTPSCGTLSKNSYANSERSQVTPQGKGLSPLFCSSLLQVCFPSGGILKDSRRIKGHFFSIVKAKYIMLLYFSFIYFKRPHSVVPQAHQKEHIYDKNIMKRTARYFIT